MVCLWNEREKWISLILSDHYQSPSRVKNLSCSAGSCRLQFTTCAYQRIWKGEHLDFFVCFGPKNCSSCGDWANAKFLLIELQRDSLLVFLKIPFIKKIQFVFKNDTKRIFQSVFPEGPEKILDSSFTTFSNCKISYLQWRRLWCNYYFWTIFTLYLESKFIIKPFPIIKL